MKPKSRLTGLRRKRRHLFSPHRRRYHRRVSGEKECKRALADAEGRLQLLSAHTRGIIFELDSQVRFVRVWTSDTQMLARPESEILGRTIIEVLGPEQGRRHHEAAKATVETGEPAAYEYELDVPTGHRHFACESVAVPASDGNRRHAVFWIRDITERIRLRNKLIRTERLASVGALAAGIAHEINNPLAYMILNAEELRRVLNGHAPEDMLADRLTHFKSCVEMFYEGTCHVQRIVKELLQLAKPDEPVGPVDVRQVLDLSMEITRTVYEGRAKVRTNWQDVPCVLAHHGRLIQVFSNLLTNAAEAIIDDNPTDNEISISTRFSGTNSVEIEFCDTGRGISRENLCHIFEPFFTTKPEGTGLGLTICQNIISSFNGEIMFEPMQPRGSMFRVSLPAT